MDHEFSAELWIWDARKDDSWTFLSVPPEVSEEIEEYSASRPRAGFGSVRISVTIGSSTWQTSVFPGEDGNYAHRSRKLSAASNGSRPETSSQSCCAPSSAEPSSRDRGGVSPAGLRTTPTVLRCQSHACPSRQVRISWISLHLRTQRVVH